MRQSEQPFVHLDVLSSFTKGAIGTASGYARSADALGQRAIGIADQDSNESWQFLNTEAQGKDLKPIFGITFAPYQSSDRDSNHPITLLVSETSGFDTVSRLVEIQNNRALELRDMEVHRDGVIALADINAYPGVVFIYDEDRLFCKLDHLPVGNTPSLNDQVEIAKGFEAQMVAGSRAWRGENRDYAQAQSVVLFQYGQKKTINPKIFANSQNNLEVYARIQEEVRRGKIDPRVLEFHPDGWLMSSNQMRNFYHAAPEAGDRTVAIARDIEPHQIPALMVPHYPTPEGVSTHDLLSQYAWEGLYTQYGPNPPRAVLNQFDHELRVIGNRQLSDYFLIASDFVHFGQARGIEMRGIGSATGSLICYVLGITNVEPVSHGLLFERFLNEKSQRVPDIDFRVDGLRRGELFDYASKRFPPDQIYPARISTYPTYGIRGAVTDVLKTFGIPDRAIQEIKQSLFSGQGVSEQYRPAVEIAVQIAQSNIPVADKTATHPTKLTFSSEPFPQRSKVQRGHLPRISDDKDTVDLLGEETIDLVSDYALTLLSRLNIKTGIKSTSIPRDDKKVLEEIFKAHTVGVPQIETPWMRKVLHRYGMAVGFEKGTYDDLIRAFAVSRALSKFEEQKVHLGSDYYELYFERASHNRRDIYSHPQLNRILRETYGVMIYQEQLMRLGIEVAGYDHNKADDLRRQMSKEHNLAELTRLANDFIFQSVHRGVSQLEAKEIAKQFMFFAGYGFLKGHSMTLMDVSYNLMYLKHQFPRDFMNEVDALKKGHYYVNGHPSAYKEERSRLGI